MVGKITMVLAKKEAETYLSQGLHQEAIKLYDQLLATSPRIDPAIKSAIESQREKIEEEYQEHAAGKSRPLTAAEIGCIRVGWGARATDSDVLVCAQAFMQVGAHAEALEEFRDLVARAGLKKIYVHALADCLVALNTPEVMVSEVRQLVQSLTADAKTALAVQVAMAKRMVACANNDHARALLGDLARIPALATGMAARLAALGPAPSPETADETAGVDCTSVSASECSRLARLCRFLGLRRAKV